MRQTPDEIHMPLAILFIPNEERSTVTLVVLLVNLVAEFARGLHEADRSKGQNRI